jgi:transposase
MAVQSLFSRTGRPAKVYRRTRRKVFRQSLVNPRITRKAIKDELEESGVNVSLSTVSNILHKAGLKGCRPRKTPLLKKYHLNNRLKFARVNVV